MADRAQGKQAALSAREVVVTLALVGALALLVVPLSATMLDLLLAVSIALSLLVFLVSFSIDDPLDFTVFPVLLLVGTVFRLSLNISSTRLILSGGQGGTASAGKIIETFGNLVAGGDVAIGLVIFIILILINFVVVTKGAGRIAEVGARFTLDAMPGKQMAIDADLNAGLIDDTEARRRRKAVALEADFHGAMDGASKFIRGDAIAGILVTVVNLVGGLFIGVVRGGMSPSEAATTYSVLTIGDGLVSQVPALIVSVSAGLLVTRVSSDGRLHEDLTGQLLGNPRVLGAAALLMVPFGLLGLGAGFFVIAAAIGAMAWLTRSPATADEAPAGVPAAEERRRIEEGEMLDQVEALELEVGFDLIPLVDEKRGGELMTRIARLRRQVARTLGFVVPPIQVQDNLRLRPTCYSILLRGTPVAEGELRPGRLLAIGAEGPAAKPLKGIAGKEPAFGLPSVWIEPAQRSLAEATGFSVVDPATVLATHLSEVVKNHAPEFIGRQEAQQLLDRAAKTHPKVVDELVPNLLPLGTVVAVLRNLLREQVSIRDMLTILEALADAAPRSEDPLVLTQAVREALGRQITAQHADAQGTIHYIALASSAEEVLRDGLRRGGGAGLALEPTARAALTRRLMGEVNRHAAGAVMPVLLVAPEFRHAVRRLVERDMGPVAVLAPTEITDHSRLRPLASVGVA